MMTDRIYEQAGCFADFAANNLEHLTSARLTDLMTSNATLVIADMINGFAKQGALYSKRVENLIPVIANTQRWFHSLGLPVIHLADTHTSDCPEFASYPVHCKAGTEESEVVAELQDKRNIVIPKNSTNGFLEREFQAWLAANPQVDTFVVVGDCTDICILQFVLTLKAWFTRQNITCRIVVPMNAVDTFDIEDAHPAEFMNLVALQLMLNAGIEVVTEIK